MTDLNTLLGRCEAIIAAGSVRDAVLRELCALIGAELPGYDWVGFYLPAPDGSPELRLGPFAGKPTEHLAIPYGKGVCGQVAESGRTKVVDDVSAEANYISCADDVRAEIVAPILVRGRFAGQLDVDSRTPSRFGAEDRRFCEALCARLAASPLFDAGPES